MIVKVPEKKLKFKNKIESSSTLKLHYNNNFLWDPNDRPCGTVLDVQKVDGTIWWINYYPENTY